jgi:hypothetical protein
MKWIVLMSLVGIWLYGGSVYAKCERLQYDELKDMSQQELITEYCRQSKESLFLTRQLTERIKANIDTKAQWDDQKECSEIKYQIFRLIKRNFQNHLMPMATFLVVKK